MKKILLSLLFILVCFCVTTGQGLKIINIEEDTFLLQYRAGKYISLLNAKHNIVGKFSNPDIFKTQYDINWEYNEDTTKSVIIWNEGDTTVLSSCRRVIVSSDNKYIYNYGYDNLGRKNRYMPYGEHIDHLYIFNRKGEIIKDFSQYYKSSGYWAMIPYIYLSENNFLFLWSRKKIVSKNLNILHLTIFDSLQNIILDSTYFNEIILDVEKIVISKNANYFAIKENIISDTNKLKHNWLIFNKKGEIIVKFNPNYSIDNIKDVIFSKDEKNILLVYDWKGIEYFNIQNMKQSLWSNREVKFGYYTIGDQYIYQICPNKQRKQYPFDIIFINKITGTIISYEKLLIHLNITDIQNYLNDAIITIETKGYPTNHLFKIYLSNE